MKSFIEKYKSDQYSQNGEDGILAEVFRRLKIKKGTFVEFGAADGKYCSNTRALFEKGWTGKLLEANSTYAKSLIENTLGTEVDLYFGPVTADNVNELIPNEPDLLSIDIDNDDYHVWKAYGGKADVVVIEINSSLAPPHNEKPGNRGSSYSAMVELGLSKGYFLLGHTGNLVFVLNEYRELFTEMEGNGVENAELYFNKSWV